MLRRDVVAEGRFLRLVTLEYTRPPHCDVVRSWQAVERCTTKRPAEGSGSGGSGGSGDGGAHGIDAVAVFAVVKPPPGATPAAGPQLVLVRQFRPPLGMHTIELPAGLVDGDEDPVVRATFGGARLLLLL